MTNRRMFARQGIALVSAITGIIAVSSSWAEETTPTLTEIIVTAQKRQQNIQDVPISVIALSAQQLKDGGVTDIKSLQALTPALTVTSTTSENVTTARIRGIGTVGDNPGLESSVGIVIDGVYRPRNGVGFGDLGEIQQIEILEGPQGELFGKNNDAGVINIVTKRPSTTFGVTGEITGGNYNDREINASITGPIGSIAAGRFYAGYQKRDGFLDVDASAGPNTDDKTDDRNMYTLRGQFLVTPSDAVSYPRDRRLLEAQRVLLRSRAGGQRSLRRHRECTRVGTAPGRSDRNRRSRRSAGPVQPPGLGQSTGDPADPRHGNFRATRLGLRPPPSSPRSPRGATTRSFPATTSTIPASTSFNLPPTKATRPTSSRPARKCAWPARAARSIGWWADFSRAKSSPATPRFTPATISISTWAGSPPRPSARPIFS